MVRRSSPLLVAAVATAAGLVIAGLTACTFTPSAASRRSLLLGGVVAGTAATVNADNAHAGFGFGERVEQKGDYSQYSKLSGGLNNPDNIYKEYGTERVSRAREQLDKSFDILSKIRPEIEAKHYNKVKQRTTMQLQQMRKHLEYVCESKQNRKDLVGLKDRITEQLDYLTVDNRVKKTTESLKDYDTLMPLFKEFLDTTV